MKSVRGLRSGAATEARVDRFPTLALLGCIITLVACGPAATRTAESPAAGTGPGASTRPKTMTIALQRELTSFGDFLGTNVGGNSPEVRKIAHDTLMVDDFRYVVQPRLAQETISVDRGTWQLHADGSMETTWRVRPNVRWHDGAAFTSADLLFAFQLYKDHELPTRFTNVLAMMESASAPDPSTFTVRWSRVYTKADQAVAPIPLPRHLLEPLYQQDKAAFINSPLFGAEWVGLGPYRLIRWEAGSMMEFVRFDDYYLGRPPLDRIVIQYIQDGNTMLANFLAGTVDVVPPENVDVTTAVELSRRLDGTGHRVRLDPTERLLQLEFQMRPEYARPSNGVTNRAVRQALYHATDRAALAEVVNGNRAPVTDHWFVPGDPLGAAVSPRVPSYPLDTNRALRLLADAGWTRGPDGALTARADGERLQLDILARAGSAGVDSLIQVVADQWRALGVQPSAFPIPAALSADREYQTKYTGVLAAFPSANSIYEVRLHSRYVSAAENRWTGQNRAGYVNPRVDQLIDTLLITINPRDQVRLHGDLAQEVFTDVPFIPVTWDVFPVLVLRGVKGDISAVNAAWNIFEWDKEG